MPSSLDHAFVDAVVAGKIAGKHKRPSPLSIRPGQLLMEACAAGSPTAKAIRDSWKFSHPITILPRQQFNELVNRNTVTFHGHLSEAR